MNTAQRCRGAGLPAGVRGLRNWSGWSLSPWHKAGTAGLRNPAPLQLQVAQERLRASECQDTAPGTGWAFAMLSACSLPTRCPAGPQQQALRAAGIARAAPARRQTRPLIVAQAGGGGSSTATPTLSDLKRSLDEAVKGEDYAAAASIRDRIAELEQQDPVLQLEAQLEEAIAEQRYEVIISSSWFEAEQLSAQVALGMLQTRGGCVSAVMEQCQFL